MRLRIVECSQAHLDKCAEHHVLGAATGPLTDWKSGDLVAFAVDRELAALARVRGLPYEEKRRLWADDVYPYRVQVEFERQLVPAQRITLDDAAGEEDAAGLEAEIHSHGPIAEPLAERIVAAIRKDRTMSEQRPPAPSEAGDAVNEALTTAAGKTAVRRVLRNCMHGSGCDRRWDDLVKTELPDVRFCTRCERAVFLCVDGDRLMDSLRKGRCVAIEAGD
jgi:hypothetical protein